MVIARLSKKRISFLISKCVFHHDEYKFLKGEDDEEDISFIVDFWNGLVG